MCAHMCAWVCAHAREGNQRIHLCIKGFWSYFIGNPTAVLLYRLSPLPSRLLEQVVIVPFDACLLCVGDVAWLQHADVFWSVCNLYAESCFAKCARVFLFHNFFVLVCLSISPNISS